MSLYSLALLRNTILCYYRMMPNKKNSAMLCSVADVFDDLPITPAVIPHLMRDPGSVWQRVPTTFTF